MTGDCVRHPGAAIVTYLISSDDDPDVSSYCEVCDREAAEEEAGAFLTDDDTHEPYFPPLDGEPIDPASDGMRPEDYIDRSAA